MAEELLRETYKICGHDFDKAGETAALIKQILKALGINSNIIHRAVVIAFEAEMNVVMYASEGMVTFVLTDEDIKLEISDKGPGIEDIEMALTEGFSTATNEMREMGFGFGMGLPNIRKNSDGFNIESEPGVGTTVSAMIRLDSSV
ncbi:MAG: anti-sigma regulatory factor [Phycisphaerae bacterium]|nr:anti-sigma regulatory factor [Phycisphaerae bacterium]